MADPRMTLLDLLAKCDQGADPTRRTEAARPGVDGAGSSRNASPS